MLVLAFNLVHFNININASMLNTHFIILKVFFLLFFLVFSLFIYKNNIVSKAQHCSYVAVNGPSHFFEYFFHTQHYIKMK